LVSTNAQIEHEGDNVSVLVESQYLLLNNGLHFLLLWNDPIFRIL